jgi:hypothetical protein
MPFPFSKQDSAMGPLGPISVMPVLKNGFWAVSKMLGRDYITDSIFTITSRISIISISHDYIIPVVPHKAVAEVSE